MTTADDAASKSNYFCLRCCSFFCCFANKLVLFGSLKAKQSILVSKIILTDPYVHVTFILELETCECFRSLPNQHSQLKQHYLKLYNSFIRYKNKKSHCMYSVHTCISNYIYIVGDSCKFHNTTTINVKTRTTVIQ